MARTALFLSPGADLAPAVALARRADARWATRASGSPTASAVTRC